MTTLYNGNLYIKGLTVVDGAVQGSTTSDIILSMLDTIPYVSTQRVMMEIGGFNRTVGNYGNIHKYLLGYSNSSSGTGGSFIIQGVPVATNTYNSTDAPITFLTISPNGNITTSESLTINTITTPFRLSQSGTTYGTVSAYGATPTCRIEAGPNTFNGNGGGYVSANNLSIAGQGLTWGGGGMGKPAEIVLEGGRSRFGALNSSNNIFFYTSGTERARFSENGLSVNGNLSVGGTLSLATGTWHKSTEGVERLIFESSGTSYYNSPTAHFFRVNQTDKLTVTNTGINVNGTLSVGTNRWHTSTEGVQRLFFESSGTSYYNSPAAHIFRVNQTDKLTVTNTGINVNGTITGNGSGLTNLPGIATKTWRFMNGMEINKDQGYFTLDLLTSNDLDMFNYKLFTLSITATGWNNGGNGGGAGFISVKLDTDSSTELIHLWGADGMASRSESSIAFAMPANFRVLYKMFGTNSYIQARITYIDLIGYGK